MLADAEIRAGPCCAVQALGLDAYLGLGSEEDPQSLPVGF
jgi:hypothetical protein